MPTNSVRGQRPRVAVTRDVVLSLDGEQRLVTLTRAEDRTLRRRLRPFLAAARPLPPPDPAASPSTAERLRQARLAVLLHTPRPAAGVQPGPQGLDRLIERTAAVYAASLSPDTSAAYRRRWAHFSAWCAQQDLAALPADPDTVVLYLVGCLDTAPSPSLGTLRGRVSAINRVHLESDQPVPGDSPALAMVMRGLSRCAPPTPASTPMSALRIDELRQICAHLRHPDPIAARDAALLHLAHVGVAPADIARLRWQDLTFDSRGVRLALRQALNREPDRIVHLAGTGASSPAATLSRWHALATSHPPLVFTRVDRHGRRSEGGLAKFGVERVLAQRTASLTAARRRTEPDLAGLAVRLCSTVSSATLRDRALLLLGFAGAFRRGEVTRLVWDDLRFTDEGMVVRLRRSKTDPLGRGRSVGIPYGRSLLTCPVRATQAWRDRVTEHLGKRPSGATGCWPGIGRAGHLRLDQPLSEEGLTAVVRRRATAAGVTGRWGGRSLRAGFISTAADQDIPLEVIAQQSGHLSLDSLVRYIRTEDPFRRNALDWIGL
jgi:integrase